MDVSFIFVPGNFPLICCEFQASAGQNRKSLKSQIKSYFEKQTLVGFQTHEYLLVLSCGRTLLDFSVPSFLNTKRIALLLELIRVAFGGFSIFEFPIIHFVCPPNFAQTFVFKCSWEYAVSPRAFEHNSLCKIWGANKVYYGEFENREWVPDRASIAEDGSYKAEVSSGFDFR